MNQILMTGNSVENRTINRNYGKNTGEPMEAKSAVRLFAIIIIVFGLILSGSCGYAVFQDLNEKVNAVIPTVMATKQGAEIKINISSTEGIRTISYAWNGNSALSIAGQNKKQVELSTTIPNTGSEEVNTLNIVITDTKGHQTKFVKNYIQKSSDTEKPTIDFENINTNIKIIVTDNEELDTVVYTLGDDEPVTVKVEEGKDEIEILVPMEQGQKTLTVEATDKAGNVETVEQEVKGATEPTIEVTVDSSDPSYLIIKAHDEDALKMVAYYINDVLYQTNPDVPLGTKDFEWRQKVERGETRVKVNAYNINEQVTEFEGIYNY